MKDILPPNTLLRDKTYQIKYPLGRGGFGITYEAIHITLEQPVAIKEFYPQDFAIRNSDASLIALNREKEEFQKNLERFKREGKVLAKLNHPNIVKVTDLFEANGTAYLVMELLNGHTLRDELASQSKGYFSPEWVKSNVDKLVDALDLVHQSGIYHLDIKPDNIMLTKDGHIVLIDFGAAKQISGKAHSTRIFTEAYAPPELMNGKAIGAESDIFEVGMMLYELLTGKRPPSAIQRLTEGQEYWQAKDVYPIWRTLVEKALILKHENRPKSIKLWWNQFYSNQTNDPSPQINTEVSVTVEVKEVFLQLGHTSNVTSMAISSDGKIFLSASCDKTIKLWDLASGKVIRYFSNHHSDVWVYSLAISPDGKYFLSSSHETIKLWELDSGEVIKSFSGYTGSIYSVAFSPNGKYFLSAGYDDNHHFTIDFWELDSGKVIKSFSGHTSSVDSVAFSPNGKYFLSASDDKTIKLWELDSGKVIKSFSDSSNHISSIAFSPNGEKFFFASGLGGGSLTTIKWGELDSGKIINSFDTSCFPTTVSGLAFSPNEESFLCSTYDMNFTIDLWDWVSNKVIKSFSNHADSVDVVFSPDGKHLLSNNNKTIELLDWVSGKVIRSFSEHVTSKLNDTNFSPDGKHFLFASDKTIKLLDLGSGKVIKTFSGHTDSIDSIAFSPDGEYFLSANNNRSVRKNNNGVFVFDGDNTVKVWYLTSDQKVQYISRYGKVQTLAVSPNGKQLAYAIAEDIILCEEPPGYEEYPEELKRKVIEIRFCDKYKFSHSNDKFSDSKSVNVNNIKFSPSGRYLVSGNDDGTIKLWDLVSGEELHSFSGHTDSVNSVAFSPDGKYLVSGSDDETIKAWDVDSGKELSSVSGHTGSVESVAFSPNGKLFLSTGHRTVKLWGFDSFLMAKQPKEIVQFARFDGEWISLTPDGYYNASPNVERYISVRLKNNQVVDIDDYRSTYYRPDIIAASVIYKSLYEIIRVCAKN